MDGVTAANWHTVRSAVLHQLAEEYRRWRKAGDKETDFGKAVEAAKRARRAVVAFDKVSKMERPAREPAAPSRSKGRTLPALSWQEQVMASATVKQKPFIALMWATGCRPAEIERGVTVRRVHGGIEIEIPGAKVTATNRQPRRKILIDASSPAGLHLGIALGARQRDRDEPESQADRQRLRRHSAANGSRGCLGVFVPTSGQRGPESGER